MVTTDWRPEQQHWGDLAFQEVQIRFAGRPETRAVALCLWQLARAPKTGREALDALARRDPNIAPRTGDQPIDSATIRRARDLLASTPRSRPRHPVRRTLLAASESPEAAQREAADVVDTYLHRRAELGTAQAGFRRALRALRRLRPAVVDALASRVPDAATALEREGLLEPETTGAPGAR